MQKLDQENQAIIVDDSEEGWDYLHLACIRAVIDFIESRNGPVQQSYPPDTLEINQKILGVAE